MVDTLTVHRLSMHLYVHNKHVNPGTFCSGYDLDQLDSKVNPRAGVAQVVQASMHQEPQQKVM